jgi:hypothetical protein
MPIAKAVTPAILTAHAANRNNPRSHIPPTVALTSHADLLAEVCVARLQTANDNSPLSLAKDQAK